LKMIAYASIVNVSVSMRADGSHAWEARHQQDPSTFSRRCDCDAPRDA
jgi:hypothetical protein